MISTFPSSGSGASSGSANSTASPGSPFPIAFLHERQRMQLPLAPRIAVIGDLEFSLDHSLAPSITEPRIGGAMNVVRLLLSRRILPNFYTGADITTVNRIGSELGSSYKPHSWTCFTSDFTLRAIMNSDDRPDAFLFADYGKGMITGSLLREASGLGIPFEIRHFTDSFRRERGPWGEAIDFSESLHRLVG